MPYQTGTFTSASDLRTTLTTFATTNGWTNSGNLLHKGNVYVEMFDDVEGLRVKAGLGKDGGNALTTPAAYTRGIRTGKWIGETMSMPGTYHLISLSSPDNIYLIVNYNVTYWQHLAFGEIVKYGTWGGGQYASGSNYGFHDSATDVSAVGIGVYGSCGGNSTPRSAGGGYMISGANNNFSTNPQGAADLYCDLDGEGWRVSYATHVIGSRDPSFYASAQCGQYLTSLNSWNQQTLLAPTYIQAGRLTDAQSFIGDMPHTRYLRIDNINDGDVITVGGQAWICFPHIRKTLGVSYSSPSMFGLSSTGNSSVLGWCIKYDGP